jgi:hypothetical protein
MKLRAILRSRGSGSGSGSWAWAPAPPTRARRGYLTSSHAHGPSSPPLLPHTIPQHFSSIVSTHGDRLGVISRSQNTRLTYRELDERSNALARGLQDRGVRKGDRVVVNLGNGWENAVLSYAVWKVGGVLVSFLGFFLWGEIWGFWGMGMGMGKGMGMGIEANKGILRYR